jgi:hypothetical protein
MTTETQISLNVLEMFVYSAGQSSAANTGSGHNQ